MGAQISGGKSFSDWFEVPAGYIAGLVRDPLARDTRRAHLYKGNYADPGLPMCRLGWNRGTSYSIWRGQLGTGICAVCRRRAREGREPVTVKEEREQ